MAASVGGRSPPPFGRGPGHKNARPTTFRGSQRLAPAVQYTVNLTTSTSPVASLTRQTGKPLTPGPAAAWDPANKDATITLTSGNLTATHS